MQLHILKNLFLTITLVMSFTLSANAFNNLVVFGDSLSDNGNLAALPDFGFLNQPPYQKGFTNGKPAVLQMANLLNLPLTPAFYLSGNVFGNNFAVAGARAGGNSAIDLLSQIGAYLANTKGRAQGNTLYIVFIGGNDIRDMRNQPNHSLAKALLDKAVKNVHFGLSQLSNAGGKNFLVINAPDVGDIPETRLMAASNPALIKKASWWTRAYNEKLQNAVKSIEKHKRLDMVVFDTFKFVHQLVEDSRAYRIANTKDACFSSAVFDYFLNCNETKINSFAYFDEIHPTQRIHQRVGRALFAVIPESK
jgi:phospholipase/lecithinase/hemolysin